jgi:hypothetical protein
VAPQPNKGFLEGMAQDMAAQFIYGNSTSPEKLMGLAPRYATLSTATSQTANNVVNGAGASSTNTSIWLIGWADDKVTGIYPKGSTAGLRTPTLASRRRSTPTPSGIRRYISHYVWKAGLHVLDWRYVARIANLETGTGTAGFKNSAPVDIVDCIDQAIAKIPNLDACRPSLYMNRTTYRYLNKQRNYGVPASSTVNLTTIRRTESGDDRGVIQRFPNYDGIPIKICDQILSTEATVS